MGAALRRIEQIVFFVDDVDEAVAWYQDVVGGSLDRSGLPSVVVEAVRMVFHPADGKTRAGEGGTVPYCRVDVLVAAVEAFCAAGASVYRGPLVIEDGRTICQVRDPFGNVLGLIGP